MNLKKIKKQGLKNHRIILYIGMLFLLLGFCSRAFHIADNYGLYGIVPVWIISICFGLIFTLISLKNIIKYLNSFKKYDLKLYELVDKELASKDIKQYNALTLVLTKNYIISFDDALKIYKYDEIKEIINLLVNNLNCIKVVTNDGEEYPIVRATVSSNSDEAVYEIIDYIQEKNNKIVKRSGNIDN